MTLPVLASQACTTPSSSDMGICHHCGLDTDKETQPYHVSTSKFSLRTCKKWVFSSVPQYRLRKRLRTVPLGFKKVYFYFFLKVKRLSLSDIREVRIMSLNPEQMSLVLLKTHRMQMVPDAKGQEPKQKNPRAWPSVRISNQLHPPGDFPHRPPLTWASLPHTWDTTQQEQVIWPFPACRGQALQRPRQGTGGPCILMSTP